MVELLVIVCVNTETQASERSKKNIYYKAGKEYTTIPNRQADTIKILTGNKDGIYFKVGKAFAQRIRNEVSSTDVKVKETQGSMANLKGVLDCEFNFGIVQSDVLYFNGPNQKAKVLGVIYREPVYILIRKKLNLSGINELRGKKVAVGENASGTKFTSEIILGIFGITLDELKPKYLDYDQLVKAFKDDTDEKDTDKDGLDKPIDAAFIVIAELPRKIKKLIEDNIIYCLKLNKSDLTQIASAHPNLYRLCDVNNPAHESYTSSGNANESRNETKKFRTISVTSVLIANSNLSCNFAVKFTNQLYQIGKQILKKSKDNKNNDVDPYITDLMNIKGLMVPYPFMLYGKKNNDEFFHSAVQEYYEDTDLWRKYTFYKLKPYIVPSFFLLLLLFVVFGPIVFKWPKQIASDRWPKWLRNRAWLSTLILFYLFIVVLSYVGLCFFESGIENPDIRGKTSDLVKVFLLYFKLGDVVCITTGGKIVRDLTLFLGGIIGIGLLGRQGVMFTQNKIREATKMIPKNNFEHIVICNWTDRINGVIGQLRSDAIRKKRRIIVIAQADDKQESDKQQCTANNRNVHIFPGDPTSVKTFRHKYLNIYDAKAILILADDKASEDPDMKSLKILLTFKSCLKENHRRPDIIVELSKPNPAIEDQMKKGGADRVISYADMKHKLLAQAVITPKAINFVREILTAEKNSNEVYELKVSKEMVQKIIDDCKNSKRKFTFQYFANEITNKYNKKYNNPITVVGVSSKENIYINPKDNDFSKFYKEFSEIYKDVTVKTAVVLVLAWQEPKRL